MAQMEYVVGIDLGTTNSVAAHVKADGSVEVIPNAEGNRITPSVVAFSKSGEIIVGEPAKRQAILNAERTVRSIKRKMGSDYKVKIDDKEYTPQEISAFILKKIKSDAEAYLGGHIKRAVITCPAYFNDAQRQATKEAGVIAGLEVLRIINEPTAAAIAYGLDKAKGEQLVIVYDFGGGTFDVSLLEIGDGIVEVKATAGNNHLGGDDIDQRVIDWLAEQFRKEHGIDLREDKQALQRLKDAAERAKIELSSKLETDISLPYITATKESGPLHLEARLTRATLESLARDLVEMTREPIERVLSDAKVSVEDIDEIILVGGTTRMPLVQKFLTDFFKKEPNKSVNPDEAVAIGAAIQAAILAGELKKDLVLVDVTPLTLGVEVKGGLMEPIIERNSKIPIKRSKVFTTAEDGQTEVEVRVYQGERPIARENIFLGSFRLTGIPPAPRGVPQIEVAFDIDSDGIVNVSAKDRATGKEQSMVVTGRQKLSPEEIEKIIQDAKRYEEQDKKRKEQIELKNRADDLAYTVEKSLKEHGDKIPADVRGNLESLIKDLRQAIEENNFQRIKILFDQLQQESTKIGQYLYQAQQAAAAGGEDSKTGDGSNDSGTVDTDYEEEK
ncbi:MAG: molecular chaperone DnaK [Thermotogae bacterium]|nr:MAG: molecular chaperone DnaK [Thermotogota bacterium]